MVASPFSIARLPRIVFGAGSVRKVASEARRFGSRALLVTGARSLRQGSHWQVLVQELAAEGVAWTDLAVEGEPTPELVDEAVAAHRAPCPDMVIGIGGGSALDAAKAIAGLLPTGASVMDYLEGVGAGRAYDGPALPFIAVPTTAGTGSEATKNAVLSRQGPEGFKKSFRDEALVAQAAIVDPDLLTGCPKPQIAANGMDAFTQLLEAYTSANANPFTDGLAWSGLEAFARGFFDAWRGEEPAATAGRSLLAYASLTSGIVLAQAGLGAVHGLASPLGAYFPIPHGVVCGTLVAEATAMNIRALQARAPGHPSVDKYARVARLLVPEARDARRPEAGLADLLRDWIECLELPQLNAFGVGDADIARIVAGCRGGSMKTNPLELTDAEIAEILVRRL